MRDNALSVWPEVGGSARSCSWAGMSAAARVATMTRTRTAVFVMLRFAGSPRRMASRQMATVLNRLGGIGAPEVCLGMALGAAEGERPMSEHSQRLGLIPDTKHPMRVSDSKSKLLQACDLLQPCRREQRSRLCTVAALAAAALAAAALQCMAPRALVLVKLRAILLATVAAVPVALAVQPCRGATTMVGRVLILITMLSTASGWKLPSNDEETRFSPHAPMITRGVSGARDRRRLVSACDNGCNECCDGFFGGSCDCQCHGSCDVGCPACSSGKYGAAEQVTCGPRAMARPPNTHLTPVHRASSSTSRVPAPQAPRCATAMVQ